MNEENFKMTSEEYDRYIQSQRRILDHKIRSDNVSLYSEIIGDYKPEEKEMLNKAIKSI